MVGGGGGGDFPVQIPITRTPGGGKQTQRQTENTHTHKKTLLLVLPLAVWFCLGSLRTLGDFHFRRAPSQDFKTASHASTAIQHGDTKKVSSYLNQIVY